MRNILLLFQVNSSLLGISMRKVDKKVRLLTSTILEISMRTVDKKVCLLTSLSQK